MCLANDHYYQRGVNPMKPCKHTSHISECRICQLAESDPRYAALWGIVREPVAVKAKTEHTPPAAPGLPAMAVKAGKAYARWIAAGRPKLSAEQINQRQEACDSCPNQVTKNGHNTCGLCGCPLGNVSYLWGSVERPGKLEMATETCPAVPSRWPELNVIDGKVLNASSKPQPPAGHRSKIRWAYGLTTVPERREDLLPHTLASLQRAGFDKPWLFIDGENNRGWWERNYPDYELTLRWPKVRTHGNWILSLYELYLRKPEADRYAVFQDDFVTYKNLRYYLEKLPYPDNGYLNLYTFPINQRLCPQVGQTGRQAVGWYRSNQLGKGAVALIFNKKAAMKVLAADHMVDRVQNPQRGHIAVDGGIVDSMRKAGFTEYVHNPSLVQHTGLVSSMGNSRHDLATSWRGEEFDAMQLLEEAKHN